MPCLFHRGKALLAYLDIEAGRLALTPAAAPASPTQSAAGGGGGNPLNRLFSRVGTTLGQALLRPEGGSSGRGAGSPAEKAAQGLQARLAVINWCPVCKWMPPHMYCNSSNATMQMAATAAQGFWARFAVINWCPVSIADHSWKVCSPLFKSS